MNKTVLRNQKMAPSNRRVAADLVHHDDSLAQRFNLPMLMGYVFLFLVFIGAVSSVYYWENKNRSPQATVHSIYGRVESGETVVPTGQKPIPTPNGQVCIIDSVTGRPTVPIPTPPNYNGGCE